MLELIHLARLTTKGYDFSGGVRGPASKAVPILREMGRLKRNQPARDYEQAFDELVGCDKDVFNCDTETLIKRMRED